MGGMLLGVSGGGGVSEDVIMALSRGSEIVKLI